MDLACPRQPSTGSSTCESPTCSRSPAPPGCYIVVLEERDGQRQLLIWIAGAEATSMALRLAGIGLPACRSAGTWRPS
jgi:hypothetical protein